MKQDSSISNLKDYNRKISQAIDRRLGVFYDAKIREAKKIDPIYATLIGDMKKFILRGGKRQIGRAHV